MSDRNSSEVDKSLDLAYEQALALQKNEPKWLDVGNTVIVRNQNLMWEFIGVNEQGLGVCRMPDPNYKGADETNKFIEKEYSLDDIANAELVLGFYFMYDPSGKSSATYLDLDTI